MLLSKILLEVKLLTIQDRWTLLWKILLMVSLSTMKETKVNLTLTSTISHICKSSIKTTKLQKVLEVSKILEIPMINLLAWTRILWTKKKKCIKLTCVSKLITLTLTETSET
jgi:hypothetical protein